MGGRLSSPKDFPKEAIKIYVEKAEETIGERTRQAYANAADTLKRVKNLYEKLNAKSEWNEYIRALRAKYANFPALQDELQKALGR
jgi:uncharacterized Zn finger protein